MKYLLDTNAIIGLFAGTRGIRERLERQRSDDICISVIVAHELYFGAVRSQRVEANLARLEALQFAIVPLMLRDVRVAADVRQSLAAQGRPIGPYDVLIAGQALAQELVLVTHNIREFEQVDGLRIEDWES